MAKKSNSIILAIVGTMVLQLPTGLSAQEEGQRLHLVCLGAGSGNRPTSATANAYNSDGTSSWATVVGNRPVPFEDQVNLWVEGDEGRLRMPRVMLPPIRGGEDGWFELRNLEITDAEITAKVSVNFMNRPDLRIDRYTGTISISGRAGNYAGQCEAYDPESTQRRF